MGEVSSCPQKTELEVLTTQVVTVTHCQGVASMRLSHAVVFLKRVSEWCDSIIFHSLEVKSTQF